MSQHLHHVRQGLRVYSLRTRHFHTQPRENEIRVLERDGRRWLQQWRMPPYGESHHRAWVEVAELPLPRASIRPIAV